MLTKQKSEKSKDKKKKVTDIMPGIMSTKPYPTLAHASSRE